MVANIYLLADVVWGALLWFWLGVENGHNVGECLIMSETLVATLNRGFDGDGG